MHNSGNKAVEFLESSLNLPQDRYPLPLIIEKLHEIAPLNKKDAKKSFTGLLDKNEIDKLLTLTHSKPPPSYVMVYSELVEKNLQLSFLGRWNFDTMEKIRHDASAIKAIPARDTKEYIEFFNGLFMFFSDPLLGKIFITFF